MARPKEWHSAPAGRADTHDSERPAELPNAFAESVESLEELSQAKDEH